MTRDHARQQVLALLDAIYSRNTQRALEFFHDDIDFIGHAPVQFFPHLGQRRGKEQLKETLLTVQTRYSHIRHELVFIAADDDKVATIIKAYLQKADQRPRRADSGGRLLSVSGRADYRAATVSGFVRYRTAGARARRDRPDWPGTGRIAASGSASEQEWSSDGLCSAYPELIRCHSVPFVGQGRRWPKTKPNNS